MDEIYELIKNNFKFSDKPVKGPSYIMPEGNFLDIYNSGFQTHGGLDEELYLTDYITQEEYMSGAYLIRQGAIRINDGSNFAGECLIDLPDKINSNQIYSLWDWLENVSLVKKTVDVGRDLPNPESKSFVFEEVDIKDIINYIKRLYIQSK